MAIRPGIVHSLLFAAAVSMLGPLVMAAPGVPNLSAQEPSTLAPDVNASIRGTSVRDAEGGPVVFPLLLRNGSDGPVEAHVQVQLPSSWSAPGTAGTVQLPSGGSRMHLLGLGVPASTRAGEYRVPWSVEVGDEPVAGDTLVVRVPPRPALALEAAERPDFVVAGSTRSLRFRLTNVGNMPLQTRLETRWSGGTSPDPEPASARLDPGETIPIQVDLRIASAFGGGVRQEVLEVFARAPETSLDVERASVPLEVVRPADGSTGPVLHSLPLEASVWGAPAGSGGLWGEVRGQGPLRAGGTTRLRLLFRGPEPRGPGLVGHDRYRVGIEGESFRLTAGDQIMRRTLLTEPGREAFGGSGEVELGPLVAGGYHGRDRRRGIDDDGASGGFVGLRAGQAASATLSRVVRSGWSPADLWSASARLRPFRILDLSGEVGREATGSDPAGARRVEASGAWSSGRYVVRHLRVDPLYPGLYRGRLENQAYLALRPVASLRLDGSLRRDADGVASRSILTGGRTTRTQARAGMGWGSAVGFEVRRTREEKGLGSALRKSRSWSGRLHMAMSAGPLRIRPVVEYGLLRGDELEGSHPILDSRLELSTSFGGASQVSASVSYQSGDPRPGPTARERWEGRVNGRLSVGSSVRFRFLVRGSRVPGPTPWTSGLLDVGATIALPHGQELEMRARATRTFGRSHSNRSSVTLGYRIPLDVPLGRAGTVGRVAGRVIERERGEGVDSVLVRMGGSAAVTDQEGRFVFPAVEPGSHRIRLDPGTLPRRSIVIGGDFRDVEARGAEDREVEFQLGSGGRIEGQVERFETDLTLAMVDEEQGEEVENLRSVGPVARALVLLDGPNGVRRRLTDRNGTFSVAGLDPGEWRIRVSPDGLPPRHRVTPDPVVVELEPAGERSVTLRVVPVSRTVRIVSQETVTVDGETDRWYTVRPDDTSLMAIARQVYDDGALWPKLWAANRERLPDPDVIESGQRLRIPEKAPLSATEKRMRDRYFEDGGGGEE